MTRIEEIRILVADVEAIRVDSLGLLSQRNEEAFRRVMARLETLVREERRAQTEPDV